MTTDILVSTEIRGAVGIITLNRPKQFNSLSLQLHQQLLAAVEAMEARPEIRCLMLKAEGKHFCTGADLKEVTGKRDSLEKLAVFLETGLLTLRRLEQSPLPVVIALQGLALAGGLELMLTGDVVFAGESAQLGDQHAQFGLVPGWGGSQRLPRLIGRRRALDLMFSARWLSAQEALDIGLVNYVVPDAELHSAAFDYCQKLTLKSSSGLALMKQLVDQGQDMNLEDSLRHETRLAAPALQDDDVSEGLAAFLEKRDPVFEARKI